MRWWVGLAVVLVVSVIGGCASSGEGSQGNEAERSAVDAGLPALAFRTSGGEVVQLAVEVADDAQEMGCGLMHRTELAEDRGMLFVYTEDSTGGFWMRNTLIPLSIAYTAADGRIVDILDMAPVPAPGNTPYRLPDGRIVPVGDGQPVPAGAAWVTYPPRAPYRYAIEANQGWFADHGIAVGDRVDVSEALAEPNAAAPPPICAERGT